MYAVIFVLGIFSISSAAMSVASAVWGKSLKFPNPVPTVMLAVAVAPVAHQPTARSFCVPAIVVENSEVADTLFALAEATTSSMEEVARPEYSRMLATECPEEAT
jgi:hypothetical protein